MTEAARAKRPSLSALRPILPYARRRAGRIVAALVALAFASLATLVVPYAIREMVDQGFHGGGAVHVYFELLIGVVGVLAVASGARYYLVMTIGERIVADLRGDFFRHLTTLDQTFFDTEKTGEIVSRLSADTTQLKSTFGSSASVALRNFFLFIGAFAMMFATSPKLSAYILIAIPLVVLPLIAAGRSVKERSRRAQETLADATAFASENLDGARVMQSFVAEDFTARRYQAAADGAYEAARVMTGARASVTAVAIFIIFSSVVVVLWLGARDVIDQKMTAGVLLQFLLYAVMGGSSVAQLSEVWNEVSQAAGAAVRIGELLALEPTIIAPPSPTRLPLPVRGAVRFERVSFNYPTRPDDPALKGVTFDVSPGETVAIVGPSGAGKSTLFQLIERFYDPTAGAVKLDGIDIRALDPKALRREIALVPQEPFIFGASVADNIAYGRPGASRADIEEAAKRAAAHGFISALPAGYDTPLGEHGATISGGERQRLAIARAILKDAPVLLLDEATSALDAANETLVQAALGELMKGRTTLVIAHRLATIVGAHRILVVDGGEIVEQGDHASLLAANGLYAKLARLQFETGAAALRAPAAE